MIYAELMQLVEAGDVRNINEFPDYYVSNLGVVYSVASRGRKTESNYAPDRPVRELVPRLTQSGYERVGLRRDDGKGIQDRYIHRLVATAFVPNPHGYETVHHKNHDRSDNRAENLEWISREDNTREAMRRQGHLGNTVRGAMGSQAAATEGTVAKYIRDMYHEAPAALAEYGKEYDSEFRGIEIDTVVYDENHDWHVGQGCIYKITNLVTGMAYVGQSVCHPRWRMHEHWKEVHFRDGKLNRNQDLSKMSLIQHAFAAYGTTAFAVEVLEHSVRVDDIMQRESFWISQCGTLFPAGYNLDYQYDFSSEPHQLRHVTSLDASVLRQIVRCLGTHKGTAEIASECGVSAGTVRKVNLGCIYYDCHIEYPISRIIRLQNTGVFPAVYERYQERRQKLQPSCRKVMEGLPNTKGRVGAHGHHDIGKLLNKKEFVQVVEDLRNLSLRMSDIALKWEMSSSTLIQINYGVAVYSMFAREIGLQYPVRIDSTLTSETYCRIIELLVGTQSEYDLIAQETGAKASVIRELNEGTRYANPTLMYPLRATYSTFIPELGQTEWMIARDDKGFARMLPELANSRTSKVRKTSSATVPIEDVLSSIREGHCCYIDGYGSHQEYYVYDTGVCVSISVSKTGLLPASAHILCASTASRFASPYVTLSERASKKMKKVALDFLVASYFVCNPEGLPFVSHIDGDWQNCSSDNLEWVNHRVDWRSKESASSIRL